MLDVELHRVYDGPLDIILLSTVGAVVKRCIYWEGRGAVY